MSKAIYCISNTEAQASAIVDALQRSGFQSSDISVLFPDKQGTRDFAHEKNTKARLRVPPPAGWPAWVSVGLWVCWPE